MSHRNPSNLKAIILGSNSRVNTTVIQAQLEALRHEYQIYDAVTYGTTLEVMLKMACLDITPENIENEVMMVLEI